MKAYCRPLKDKGSLWYDFDSENGKSIRFGIKYKYVSRCVKHTPSGKKRNRQLAKKHLTCILITEY